MNNKRNLEDRLANIEAQLEALLEGNPQKKISRDEFMKFYNRARYELPMNGIEPLAICLHKKYSKSLQNEVLYPADDTPTTLEAWYVMGETSPVPIVFDDIKGDYVIDTRQKGTFKSLGIT